jgi:hypothetical protein
MPTQIEIQPDIANKLFAIAKMRGISIDTLLRQILKRFDKTDESSNDWRLGAVQSNYLTKIWKAAVGKLPKTCKSLC